MIRGTSNRDKVQDVKEASGRNVPEHSCEAKRGLVERKDGEVRICSLSVGEGVQCEESPQENKLKR